MKTKWLIGLLMTLFFAGWMAGTARADAIFDDGAVHDIPWTINVQDMFAQLEYRNELGSFRMNTVGGKAFLYISQTGTDTIGGPFTEFLLQDDYNNGQFEMMGFNSWWDTDGYVRVYHSGYIWVPSVIPPEEKALRYPNAGGPGFYVGQNNCLSGEMNAIWFRGLPAFGTNGDVREVRGQKDRPGFRLMTRLGRVEVRDDSLGNRTTVNINRTTVKMLSDADIASLHVYDSSQVNVYGGTVTQLYALDTSSITFHGYDFRATGGLSLDGDKVLGTGILTGRWYGPDDTMWAMTISGNDAGATILAIPEPATLSLLALCGLAMMRRRGRK